MAWLLASDLYYDISMLKFYTVILLNFHPNQYLSTILYTHDNYQYKK